MKNKTKSRLSETFIDYKRALEKMLANFIHPNDVEDIVQETWVRVARAELKKDIEYPKSFMYQTAKNLALDHLRKSDNRLTDSLSDVDGEDLIDPDFDSTFSHAASSEKFECFCRAIRTLPNTCRRAFILKKVYGFSQKEIAQYMKVTESAVEKHIARGMLMCRDHMRSVGALPEIEGSNEKLSPKSRVRGL